MCVCMFFLYIYSVCVFDLSFWLYLKAVSGGERPSGKTQKKWSNNEKKCSLSFAGLSVPATHECSLYNVQMKQCKTAQRAQTLLLYKKKKKNFCTLFFILFTACWPCSLQSLQQAPPALGGSLHTRTPAYSKDKWNHMGAYLKRYYAPFTSS